MAHAVEFTRSADRDLEKIPPLYRGRILRRIANLSKEPRPMGVKKLAGAEDLYRIRVGNYRVVYQTLDRARKVIVARIGHRREVYRSR